MACPSRNQPGFPRRRFRHHDERQLQRLAHDYGEFLLDPFIASLSSATAVADEMKVTPNPSGQLRLKMRTVKGSRTQFVYPCVWEEANRGSIVEYKTGEGEPGEIQSVTISIYDTGKNGKNVVWSSPQLDASNDWADSQFHTRTNMPRSVDADGYLNVDNPWGHFKFLDPGLSGANPKVYTAELALNVVRTAQR